MGGGNFEEENLVRTRRNVFPVYAGVCWVTQFGGRCWVGFPLADESISWP